MRQNIPSVYINREIIDIYPNSSDDAVVEDLWRAGGEYLPTPVQDELKRTATRLRKKDRILLSQLTTQEIFAKQKEDFHEATEKERAHLEKSRITLAVAQQEGEVHRCHPRGRLRDSGHSRRARARARPVAIRPIYDEPSSFVLTRRAWVNQSLGYSASQVPNTQMAAGTKTHARKLGFQEISPPNDRKSQSINFECEVP
ncbi:hypothetical protein K440DRAFT_643377 [Wilcoxina mikolae CBS 423.85]|nr:hypothetical protein K440DRAFT_643377 [Wilcoxina mikolae CBS 423.85]